MIDSFACAKGDRQIELLIEYSQVFLLIALSGEVIESIGIEQRTYQRTDDRDGQHSLDKRTIPKNCQKASNTLIDSGS